ncbi:MAG: 50S ribosomal protein L25 [Bryobacterales bacterium]|nr:50S ribosomal protein L25 [Bryobacterales bacterium]MBV9397872.1 50S ribosomal protein L25 [Bryobacterales bacterium]
MRKDITVTAEPRESRGKNEARRLRAGGNAPAVLYGVTGTAVPVAVSPKEINRILHSRTGSNTIFNLAVTGGENTPVMIVDWQSDPVKDNLIHVDLKRVDLNKAIRVRVPVVTTGEPKGVKIQGGLHETVTREVEIECLPDSIPEQFSVDVAELMIGQNVRAGSIQMGDGIKLVSSPDTVISHVVALRAEETTAAAEGAEGAPAPAAAEPEVIKKGKKEEEGAAPAEEKKKK